MFQKHSSVIHRAFGVWACAICILGVSTALNAQQKKPASKDGRTQSAAVKPDLTAQSQPAKSASDKKTADTSGGKKAAGSKKKGKQHDPQPRREPSYSEILKALQKDATTIPRPITPPRQAPGRRYKVAPSQGNAIDPMSHKLLPDGARLVDRPGRLTREADYFTFAFESRSKGVLERPIRLLPNRLLEDMEIASAGGTKPIVFVISGEVTEYRGVNYLLIQKLLVRPNLGNLK